MSNGNCVVGATHTADIKALQDRVDRHDEDADKMWEAIDRLRNRLPVWATLVISLLTFLCGILLTWGKMKGG